LVVVRMLSLKQRALTLGALDTFPYRAVFLRFYFPFDKPSLTYVLRLWATYTIYGIAVFTSLTGCAVNNLGTLAAKMTHGQGATVIEVSVIGIHLRTWSHDPGISFGLTKRSYIFPTFQTNLAESSWHYGWLKMPQTSPLSLHLKTLGLEFSGGPLGYGILLGYRERTILAQVDQQNNLYMELFYIADEPANTHLILCQHGEYQCQK
ncbi:MAG: hypothetical protein KDC45_06795, partial [Bacteroidetes bacterium]|nr:hypothetical protein [Bacteroidota bacterium]